MENKKGNEIFLGVVGVATLLVAIIGATFAYFSASAQSDNEAINTSSTVLQLGYDDDPSKLSTSLIPTADDFALMAGTNENWIAAKPEGFTHTDGKKYIGQGLCKDSNRNEICGIYTFTIGNPNFTTAMTIEGSVISTKNEFENIWFAIYDETNTQVIGPTQFPESGDSVPLPGLKQQLVGSSLDASKGEAFDPTKPSDYTPVVDKSDPKNANTPSNVRTYKMVIWVHEAGGDQTEVDSGKFLTAAIRFETESGAGVTGVIAAADAN